MPKAGARIRDAGTQSKHLGQLVHCASITDGKNMTSNVNNNLKKVFAIFIRPQN